MSEQPFSKQFGSEGSSADSNSYSDSLSDLFPLERQVDLTSIIPNFLEQGENKIVYNFTYVERGGAEGAFSILVDKDKGYVQLFIAGFDYYIPLQDISSPTQDISSQVLGELEKILEKYGVYQVSLESIESKQAE